MERMKKTIDITKKDAVIRFPLEYVDRLRAEGVTEVKMFIDDEQRILVIRPVEK